MKSVGVSEELNTLFQEYEFLKALYVIDNTPDFQREKDRLIDYWIHWLQDAEFQLAAWLTLAAVDSKDPVSISLIVEHRLVSVSPETYIIWVKRLGPKAITLLTSAPFYATFESQISQQMLSNLINWMTDPRGGTLDSANGNYLLARELVREVQELTMRLLQLAVLTRNRLQMAAYWWDLGHLLLNSFH